MPTPAPSGSDTSMIPTYTPSDLQARAQAALTLWRTRLLDLSKRNRALNFRPTKVSTVAIVDERPVEVYRHLCLDGRAMRFRPTLPSVANKDATQAETTEDEEAPPTATASDVHDAAADVAEADIDSDPARLISADDSDALQTPELDFTPYSPDTLDAPHTDSVLQALATPEALDKSLRRLDEQACTTIDEQGVNVLFLALGMLHYTDSADSDVVLRAPLVMVPVSLTRKSARTGYTIEATDDDPIVNPALAEYLRREYGVTLPDLHSPDSPGEQSEQGDGTDDDVSSLQRFYQSVMDVVADRTRIGQSGWSVKTDIFLGLFSFQKLVMFKDLEAHASEFTGHDMVRQLVTREAPPGTVVMGLPEDVRDLELDRDFPREHRADRRRGLEPAPRDSGDLEGLPLGPRGPARHWQVADDHEHDRAAARLTCAGLMTSRHASSGRVSFVRCHHPHRSRKYGMSNVAAAVMTPTASISSTMPAFNICETVR